MKLGAQLFSIRTHLQNAEDLRKSFLKIKEIGYENVQLSGAAAMPAEIIRDASEESGATVAALGEYVGYQRGGGGLTVRAGYSEAGFPFAEFSEHTGALDHPVAFFTCVSKLPETVGNGGGVNHKRIPDIRGKA